MQTNKHTHVSLTHLQEILPQHHNVAVLPLTLLIYRLLLSCFLILVFSLHVASLPLVSPSFVSLLLIYFTSSHDYGFSSFSSPHHITCLFLSLLMFFFYSSLVRYIPSLLLSSLFPSHSVTPSFFPLLHFLSRPLTPLSQTVSVPRLGDLELNL